MERVPGTGKHRNLDYPQPASSPEDDRTYNVISYLRSGERLSLNCRLRDMSLPFETVVRRGPLVFLCQLHGEDVGSATACNPALTSTSRPTA